jgi:hypothetical protein
MADDWARMMADAKKLEARIRDLTLNEAKGFWKALQARDTSMETHEKALQKAAIAAYEAGVGSKKLSEFQKDKGFAAAFKLLEADRKLLVAELKQMEAQCDKCKVAARQVEDLIGVMDKALVASKTKEKSAERTAAKKVRDALYERFNDLNAASDLRYLPDKYMTGFDATFDKIIDHLIAEAFRKGKDPAEAAEVPQPLADKKLQAALKEAQALHKTVFTCLDKKTALQPPNAQIDLLTVKAWAAQDALHKLVMEFEALIKKFRKELAEADPKGEVEDRVKAIAKLHDAAREALGKDSAKAGKLV